MMYGKRKLAAYAVVLAIALALAGCGARAADRVTVATAEVRSGALARAIEISGVLAPNKTANIFSRLPGQAKTVAVDVGSRVKAGQMLIEIDTRQLAAQLGVAEAALQGVRDQAAQAKLGIDTAKENLDMAQKSFDRVTDLFKSAAATQSQLDDASTRLDLAKTAYENANRQYQLLSSAGLAQAQAQVNLIQVQIDNATITSPMDGIVTNRNINPGELASPAAPLLTIADTRVLRLQGNVSQDEVPLLKAGDQAVIRVDGMPDKKLKGTIVQIGPVAASTGQYFPVVVQVANDGTLLAGMTATAEVKLSTVQGLLVPLSAVLASDAGSFLYVVDGGKVSRRAVTVGLKNATEIQVTGGIAAGERVVTSNVAALRDGMTVGVSQ